MAHHKLLLDDELQEDFSVVAIHCSGEAYKMAYLLNKHVGLRLQRKTVDLDYSNDGLEVTFPIFEYENELKYMSYHLVANKCKSISAQLQSSGGLFDEQQDDKIVWTYVLPEFKNVDFILKIESDVEKAPIRNLVSDINEIREVISAYSLDYETIRSKTNLIFN